MIRANAIRNLPPLYDDATDIGDITVQYSTVLYVDRAAFIAARKIVAVFNFILEVHVL
jgi:hypothetical protein